MYVWEWITIEECGRSSKGIFETEELAIKTMKEENGYRTPIYKERVGWFEYKENWESTREQIIKREVITE